MIHSLKTGRRNVKSSKLALFALVAVVGILVGTAIAAHRPPPTVEFVARGTIGHLDASNQRVKVKRLADARGRRSADHAVVELTFAPGSSTGWHKHPGVVLVTVASGRLQHWENCTKTVYEAGDSFVEQGHVGLARNVWDVDTKVYATWIMPSWRPALTVPVDAPRGCSHIH
jgi:mannose-6-phosphate isomerase-like protein (cupin superfamily)